MSPTARAPKEIRRQHPRLSLAQIHAPLAGYYDHQAAFDAQIAECLAEAERLALATTESPLRRRLQGSAPHEP